ncbi:TetR/AcrR family transcriptional regulator C-terminal domain-containing protein [Streptomyces hoynatensis]|uniref:Transcriptional regulator TetR C-terminal Proteobacteria type domain-containing protein n=1 Tax=Streptomyces hoynatensis TaxID=1141874 RepID=A0A3A9ZEB0_9ACTN|nr:TetR/AcrR family transcriptional regulator C-terminal domain-containing protein [Streptomyces hoynatensis]RKN46698.1 hypothetical protein D7294_00235 [Streptomyces hoynatensis]
MRSSLCSGRAADGPGNVGNVRSGRPPAPSLRAPARRRIREPGTASRDRGPRGAGGDPVRRAPRIPGPVLTAWIEAGPQTAHLRLAPYLARMADRGLLLLDDPERAADHFNLLTVVNVNQRTFHGAIPLPPRQVTELVTSGVGAFLRLYAAPRTGAPVPQEATSTPKSRTSGSSPPA